MREITKELNLLVFRYLQDSGFGHAAFSLWYEASIHDGGIAGDVIPAGALIGLVQEGLEYKELKANTDKNVEDVQKDSALLETLDIITKDVDGLRQIVKKRKCERLHIDSNKVNKKRLIEDQGHHPGGERETGCHGELKYQKRGNSRTQRDMVQEKEKEKKREKQHTEHVDKDNHGEDSLGKGPTPMDASTTHEICSAYVTVLEGHSSQVNDCAWSPDGSLLASGSGDATARIWTILDGPRGSIQSFPPSAHVLKQSKGRPNKDGGVRKLDWNGEGTLLATGHSDGHVRIWSRDGEPKHTLLKHKGAISSLKWSRNGDFLLSASMDKTAIVWDTKTWECKQQFKFHSGPVLGVDWQNDNSFATCSMDNMIYICKIGDPCHVKAFKGHQGDVIAIKWDPTGHLLASCSSDYTAKIWKMDQDKCVYDFKGHTEEIYTVKWSPTGPGTDNPNGRRLLASASDDSLIKLWDVDNGRLLHSLAGHRDQVFSVAFNPDGRYLASGATDGSLHIWSVQEGKSVKTYTGGPIFEVCWNKDGSKIAACSYDKTVTVIDFRKAVS